MRKRFLIKQKSNCEIMGFIKQKDYGKIEIDDSESDVLQLWQIQRKEANVVFVEREKLAVLIASLMRIYNNDLQEKRISSSN